MPELIQSDFEFTAFLAKTTHWYATDGRAFLEAERYAPLSPAEADWLLMVREEVEIVHLKQVPYGTRELFAAIESDHENQARIRATITDERHAA